jgi:acyl-CoA thioester hydrolase
MVGVLPIRAVTFGTVGGFMTQWYDAGLMNHKYSEASKYVDTFVNVRYAETDQMGIVYYANYLVWFEVGRVAWCKARGFHYADMESSDGRFLIVAEASCRYKSPAQFADDILVRTALSKATDRVLRFHYEIRRKETGQLLATGETAHVITDAKFRPARLPEHYRSFFGLPPRT